jgi:hypothetical protein
MIEQVKTEDELYRLLLKLNARTLIGTVLVQLQEALRLPQTDAKVLRQQVNDLSNSEVDFVLRHLSMVGKRAVEVLDQSWVNGTDA